MNNLDDFLREKEKTHGPFHDTAAFAQTLKNLIRNGRNWEGLPSEAKESLEQLVTMVARILNGDPTYSRHWNHAAGYMRLRVNALHVDDDLGTGIATIARRLRPQRINDEGGAV
jgi:hypothetical protein